MTSNAPPPIVVPGPQRHWFVPGALEAGARVVCRSRGRTIALTVPARRSGVLRGADGLGGGIQASVAVRPNGAAEVDCDTTAAPPVRAAPPYVVGRNGLALLRGVNTLARLRVVYGPGTATRARRCHVRWRTIGLSAMFASCAPGAALVAATVTSPRWTSLNGARVGDSVARLLWQNQGAVRVAERTWALDGRRRPRLVARVDRGGRVTQLAVER